MAPASQSELSIVEADVIKVILEFLENHKFHLTQLSLERESGIINGDYGDDVIFLRQLIIDGQWDNALDFVAPLRELPEFDDRTYRYLILKYKYYELLCIKQEPGPMHDNDFAVEEIVECLRQLESLSPSADDYRRLCALLTLPKLSDHADFCGWNPSSARVECFQKICPLVSGFLENINPKKEPKQKAANERLLQLVVKGLFYEACVDFCQAQALGDRQAIGNGPVFGNVLALRGRLSGADLSLVSWLEILSNEQFTTPFPQHDLNFTFNNLRKPRLEAQWSEHIMATPIKPGGQFPHSLIPKTRLKCAEKMSRSMFVPPMSSSFVEPRSMNSNMLPFHPMSQSTAPGFVIVSTNPQSENVMEQSQLITSMFQNSQYTKQSAGASLIQELAQSRRELENITKKANLGTIRPKMLPVVPELSPLASPSHSNAANSPAADTMTRSRLFQEFANRRSAIPIPTSVIMSNPMPIPPPIIPNRIPNNYPMMDPRQMHNPAISMPQSPPTVICRPATAEEPIRFVPLCRYEDVQACRTVAWHPSGQIFIAGTNSKQLIAFKYPNVQNIPRNRLPIVPEVGMLRSKQHRGSVYCCGFNASGNLLATGSNDKTVRLMSFGAEECRVTAESELSMHDGTVRDLIFMEEPSKGSVLISGGAGNCGIHLTDCNSSRTFKTLFGHSAPILGLYAWNSGNSFVSCSQDRSIRFWDVRASAAVNTILPNANNSPVTSVCVDSSGRLLVSGHEDASVALWDLMNQKVVQLFRPHGDEVRTVRLSNSAYYLLTASYDKRIVITDMRGDLGGPLAYMPVAEHSDKVIQCRWHPHDFTFLSASADRSCTLWTLPSN